MSALDTETRVALEQLVKRRRYFLGKTPPDRVEAQRCLDRADYVLDMRPAPVGVAGDGETVMSDQSSWVQAQVEEGEGL